MPALEDFCNLVTDVGLASAEKLRDRFENYLLMDSRITINQTSREKLFLGFIFMNWAIANGTWSNLTNTKLRRDLMSTSKRTFSLKTALKLANSQDPSINAALAVNIEEQLYTFIRGFIQNGNKFGEGNISPAANTALFYALEWIQVGLGIDDAIMNRIVPQFLLDSKDFAEIEEIAAQVIRAELIRKKTGFLARLF